MSFTVSLFRTCTGTLCSTTLSCAVVSDLLVCVSYEVKPSESDMYSRTSLRSRLMWLLNEPRLKQPSVGGDVYNKKILTCQIGKTSGCVKANYMYVRIRKVRISSYSLMLHQEVHLHPEHCSFHANQIYLISTSGGVAVFFAYFSSDSDSPSPSPVIAGLPW